MIDINLVPAALRKDGKGSGNSLSINIPHDILLGVGSGVVLLIVTVHLILGIGWMMGMTRLTYENAQWQKILPEKTEIDSMNKESTALSRKIKTLSDMTTKKAVLWAPKFNAISDDIPRGLWIRKMTLDKSGLTIEGSVVSKTQNEINNVGLFLATLKKNDNFRMSIIELPMRIHGLLPIILVVLMVSAVFFGYSQGHVVTHPKSLMPETSLDGLVFLLLSAAVVYGGQVLYRKD